MSLTEDIDLKDLVRTIPDYPKPGIMFRDITTLLGHANGLRACIERLVAPFTNRRIELVAGIEARGFILGGAVADRLALRLRADPQEGQAACEGHRPGVRARIRHRHHRNPRGCAEARRAGAARRRPHRHRRHGVGCGQIAAQAECRGGWRRLRHRSAGSWRLRSPRQARGRVPHADGPSRAIEQSP